MRYGTSLKLAEHCLELLNKGHNFLPTFTFALIVIESFEWDTIYCNILNIDVTGHPFICETSF